jgi:hypothetical protein
MNHAKVEPAIARNKRTWAEYNDEDWWRALFADSEDYEWFEQAQWSAHCGVLADLLEMEQEKRTKYGPISVREHAILCLLVADERMGDGPPLPGVTADAFWILMYYVASEAWSQVLGGDWHYMTVFDKSMTILLWDLRGGITAEDIDWMELDAFGNWSVYIIHVADDGTCRCEWTDVVAEAGMAHHKLMQFEWPVEKRIPRELRKAVQARWTYRSKHGLEKAFAITLRELYESWCVVGWKSHSDEEVDEAADEVRVLQ